jgi:hydrogenase expression/formation protein HypC
VGNTVAIADSGNNRVLLWKWQESSAFLTGETMCLGIPGQITEIVDETKKLALVNVGGVKREVNIACIVDEEHSARSCVGDWVLIHVGFAMNRIDAEEAAETLKLMAEMAEIQDELMNYN